MMEVKYEAVVLGAGESGVGAALLYKSRGLTVFVSDYGTIADKYKAELEAAAIPYEEGVHSTELILRAHEIVKSPGIPEKAPIMQAIRAAGIPVISEIELAGRYLRPTTKGIGSTDFHSHARITHVSGQKCPSSKLVIRRVINTHQRQPFRCRNRDQRRPLFFRKQQLRKRRLSTPLPHSQACTHQRTYHRPAKRISRHVGLIQLWFCISGHILPGETL